MLEQELKTHKTPTIAVNNVPSKDFNLKYVGICAKRR